MIFNHFSLSVPASDLLQSYIDRLSSLQEPQQNASLEEKPPSPFPFFFPLFQKADQVLAELHRAGICDISGNPFKEFNFLEFPPLSFKDQEAKDSLLALNNFLSKDRQLESILFQNPEGLQKRLDVPANFCLLLRYLINVSYYSPVPPNQGQQVIPPMPIQDVQLIGSHVLCLLKEAPLRHAAEQFFGSLISSSR